MSINHFLLALANPRYFFSFHRAHVRAQVANIESTKLVSNFREAGEEIVVEGWVYDGKSSLFIYY